MAKSNVEIRLAVLEAEVTQLKKNAAATNETQSDWLTETFGAFADFPEYDQVIEYGKKYRDSLRPATKARATRKLQPNKPATQKV